VSAPYTVLIPARLASTRLPRKPLADIGGKPMIVRVAERAARSRAGRVVVATDSSEIMQACAQHRVDAVLTRSDHLSGSDRLAEACARLGLPDDAIVVNLQGDEPLMDPGLVDRCAALLDEQADCMASTVAHPIVDPSDFVDPNVVKVVLDARGRALYFSRAPIPCWRDAPKPARRSAGDVSTGTVAAVMPEAGAALRHVGLYAYRVGYLARFPALEAAPLERLEALEQLRMLWHGDRIAVHVAPHAPAAGVDTPADLERVRRLWTQGLDQK
jgi:3-deoxy-manno-octulosonate cytidylyltransferase (CMP-KDO synthetase)